MQLDKLTVKVRPRKSWEAIDLGIALLQQHAAALYKIWFLITLPVYFCVMFLPNEQVVWGIFIFWLLKPLWERPLLHYLSRHLFGEELTVKDCVKSFFGLAKIQWFASLTWRRFSFTRSLDLPIIQLENLSGQQRSQRLQVIHSVGSGSAVWLTMFFMGLEIAFFMGVLTLLYLLVPPQMANEIDIWFWFWFTASANHYWFEVLQNLITYLAISLVAPFYVACGFALYINQRTHLEAWDIELAFKRLAERLKRLSRKQATQLASLFLSISILFMHVPDLMAQAEESTQTVGEFLEENIAEKSPLHSHKKVKETIKKIKQGEDFNQVEKQTYYKLRNKFDDNIPEKESSSNWPVIGHWLGYFISFIVNFALWVVAGVLILFLIIKYRYLITGKSVSVKNKKARPEVLFGMTMAPESLPDSPSEVAAKMLASGDYRQGISLLYRASLIWVIDNTDIIIQEGDTELECLVKMQKISVPKLSQFMQQLTFCWRSLAYAHQIPDPLLMKELCERWPSIFATRDKSKEQSNDPKANVDNLILSEAKK